MPGSGFLTRAAARVHRIISSSGGPGDRQINTQLLRLEYTRYPVPMERAGAGGGITALGTDMLLLTHEGRFFVLGRTAAERIPIPPPANGFEAYRRKASGKFSHLQHHLDYFRYNDVRVVETGGDTKLVVSYTEWHDAQDCYTNSLAILSVPPTAEGLRRVAAAEGDWNVIFRTRPCLPLKSKWHALSGHFAGGRMAWNGRDLFLASGDYNWDGMYGDSAFPQLEDHEYGKIIRVDVTTGHSALVSLGHRNPQGIHVDDAGIIWEVEHGMRGGDELNAIRPGKDYGWPSVTYGTRYTGLPLPVPGTPGSHEGYEKPVFAWLPSIAVSNITQIHGFDPSWDGDLLVSSLAGRSLFRLRLDSARSRVIYAEPIEIGERIRYAYVHSDGTIALWTDSREILMLRKTDEPAPVQILEAMVTRLYGDGKRASAVTDALNGCAECHSFSPADHAASPSLHSVVGRRIASTPYARYSTALRERSGDTWTAQSLVSFILDPAAFAPGTVMPAAGLDDAAARDLVGLLEAARDFPGRVDELERR